MFFFSPCEIERVDALAREARGLFFLCVCFAFARGLRVPANVPFRRGGARAPSDRFSRCLGRLLLALVGLLAKRERDVPVLYHVRDLLFHREKK